MAQCGIAMADQLQAARYQVRPSRCPWSGSPGQGRSRWEHSIGRATATACVEEPVSTYSASGIINPACLACSAAPALARSSVPCSAAHSAPSDGWLFQAEPGQQLLSPRCRRIDRQVHVGFYGAQSSISPGIPLSEIPSKQHLAPQERRISQYFHSAETPP